ncbi:hypothetical protein C8F04DRAFT_1078763 [Mycena alexandri]|uniref:Dolichyl-diphosphooligosaccharide-protein glycotransferase n=1 Tax=Mycena alexandri TaxID=1745969 RepID=A0AAD6XE05_9AGAR|nr:hypothetical protein C8F04DRAFT_1078763 [Mycena alexandri]
MLWLPLLLCALSLARAGAVAAVHEELVNLAAAGRGIIKLDSTSYELLISGNRNWSASIEFTALNPLHKCGPCNQFHSSWTAVAKAWGKAPSVHRDGHFFATLDFDAGPAVFRKLGLVSAPAVYIYPPTEGPRATNNSGYWTYDFDYGFGPERLAQQLSDLTPIPVPYVPPFNWVRWAAISGSILVLGAALCFIAPVWMWAFGTIFTSLVMTSGFMFTRIRESPWVGDDGGWIARGAHHQFGKEVPMVFAIYATLAFSFAMLIMFVPNQHSARSQRIHVYVWSAVILLVYSVLIVFYKTKRTGYPFKLVL